MANISRRVQAFKGRNRLFFVFVCLFVCFWLLLLLLFYYKISRLHILSSRALFQGSRLYSFCSITPNYRSMKKITGDNYYPTNFTIFGRWPLDMSRGKMCLPGLPCCFTFTQCKYAAITLGAMGLSKRTVPWLAQSPRLSNVLREGGGGGGGRKRKQKLT